MKKENAKALLDIGIYLRRTKQCVVNEVRENTINKNKEIFENNWKG